ncbi:MAG: 2Fe-2S iron-sulfur cluster-binding protein, partial [Pseudomonadota bacterium]
MIPLHDRLPSGGLIDRDRRLRFFFNGKSYYGYEGDSLASALLANSVHLTGRSFKYHRPRGIQGYGYEEPATLVQLEGLEDAANWPVTRVPLYEGLRARSINCWPGPAFDLGGVAQAFAQLLPAGFYYKTFMWPDWHLFEPLIRKAAGLGQAPTREAKDLHYESRHHHCDVLVIGAGPAGLMAAMTAGAAGADVLLVDDDLRVGGRLLSETAEIDGEPAEHWLKGVEDRLRAMPSVQYLPQATAWAYHDHNLIMVTERAPAAPHVFQRTWRVRAKEVVLASGAIERPLVFENNDRPGVMLASAARGYAKRYGVRAGGKAVFFANNDSAWRAAFELAAAGVTVASIVDIRADVTPDLAQQAHEKDIDVHLDSHVATALGHKHIRGVKIGSQGNKTLKQVDCDLLCVSGGWNPAVHLFSQSRGSLKYHPSLTSFVPDQTAQRVRVAGSANGTFDLASCLRDGMAAGLEAGRAAGFEAGSLPLPNSTEGFSYGIEPHWGPQDQDSAGKKAFVDVQNDVTVADLDLAVREGFGAVEHAKRYTTTGMGIDQGKTGNINAIGILSGITGTELDQVGTTTFRPPYVPIEFGAVVGARPGPEILVYRHTPMTQWHKDQGAEMYEAGARWRRPGYYPKDDETWLQAAIREAEAVRNRLGVYDGSPLGKYVIKGPDALKLLELVYTNDWANLKPQRGRYGLMLTDDGLILDDGVTFKLGDDHYLM